MGQKTTVIASSDTALVKYWGKKDPILRLPENGSISIILSGLDTTTTVEFQEDLTQDDIIIQGDCEKDEVERVRKHLQRIREAAKIPTFAKVVSVNNFPKSTGLSSSGSGFAALTIAATKASGLELNEKELSILARQGSGSACRCVCGGFVEWQNGTTSESSFSISRFSSSHWDLRDVVAVVSEDKKMISSTEGHESAQSSIFFQSRQQHIKNKISNALAYIEKKDFIKLGELIEAEALEFHSILFTSTPPLILWHPGTIEVMHAVRSLRHQGILAYFTINTGFNVHILTLPEFEKRVQDKLNSLTLVRKTLLARVGEAPITTQPHLF